MADIWDDGYNHGWYDGLTAIQDIVISLQIAIDLKSTPDWYEYHGLTLNKVMDKINNLLKQNLIEEEN
jgi:hypothetical protein